MSLASRSAKPRSRASSPSAGVWPPRCAKRATSSFPRTSRATRPEASTAPGREAADRPLRRLRRHLPMNGEELVLALDEGTTGATAIAVGVDGEIRGKGYQEITQHYPRPGWVEHDASEIWSAVKASARQALDATGAKPSDVRAVGITNQRETLVLWDRRTLEPISRAIVWQDRRTADECTRLRVAGHEGRVRETTGLVLDPYFTATKYAWALRHVEGAAAAAAGTVDSWMIGRLSAGRDHVTDASNASRTLL